MTGLDIWASLLSTGIICTFYTTVVSDPTNDAGTLCPLGLLWGRFWVRQLISDSPFSRVSPCPSWSRFSLLYNEGDLKGLLGRTEEYAGFRSSLSLSHFSGLHQLQAATFLASCPAESELLSAVPGKSLKPLDLCGLGPSWG